MPCLTKWKLDKNIRYDCYTFTKKFFASRMWSKLIWIQNERKIKFLCRRMLCEFTSLAKSYLMIRINSEVRAQDYFFIDAFFNKVDEIVP